MATVEKITPEVSSSNTKDEILGAYKELVGSYNLLVSIGYFDDKEVLARCLEIVPKDRHLVRVVLEKLLKQL